MANDKLTLEIVTKSSASGTGGDTGGAIGGGTKGKTGGTLGALSKLIAVVGVVVNLLWSFKPVITLLSQLAKMIGLFLQPIAETLLLIIKPIMTMLKPIVMAFRNMMAPFMDIIRQASILMNKQAAAGDTGGMAKTGNFMMRTIMKPFFMIMANIFGKMLFIDGAKMLKNTLIDMISLALEGLFGVIDKLFGTDLVAQLEVSTENLKQSSDKALDSWGERMDTTLSKNLVSMEMNARSKLLDLQESFNNDLGYAVVDPVANAVDKLIEQKKRLDRSFGSSGGGGTVMTKHGGVSTAFPDAYEDVRLFNKKPKRRDDISYPDPSPIPWVASILTK